MESPDLFLKNVRVHNLKGVDLRLKPNQLIVFSGVSGSGKSSLAFDTIYKEGQRRYLESLSTFAKRQLGGLDRPEAEIIEGLSPCIAIEQKTAGKNPRSTVGTMTAIYDYLRVLYARLGVYRCPVSLEVVQPQTPEKLSKSLLNAFDKKKIYLLAPLIKGQKGEFKEILESLRKKGYIRARINGQIVELENPIELNPKKGHDIDVVIDRLSVTDEVHDRLIEAILQGLKVGNGLLIALDADNNNEMLYSTHAYSPASSLSYGPLEPHHFSFNHPEGMCTSCQGLGLEKQFKLEKVIQYEKSIEQGAFENITSLNAITWNTIYQNLSKIYKFSLATPFKDLTSNVQKILLNGNNEKYTKMTFTNQKSGEKTVQYIPWKGVLHELKERYDRAKSDLYKEKLSQFLETVCCTECKGARIRPYPAATLFHQKTLFELTKMSIDELLTFFKSLTFSQEEQLIGQELFREVVRRLTFLKEVGLGYLSLERGSPTLSGGESQRVRLASQVGQGLVGTTYILDEPSIGLHPRDNERLLKTLQELVAMGNTVIVVEHDEETIINADTIVDVGPFGGCLGGEILSQGTLKDLLSSKRSITAAFLNRTKQIKTPEKRREPKQFIKFKGICHHNLLNVDVDVPLGVFIAVTGVSGSGKSSLVSEIFYPALSNLFMKSDLECGHFASLEGETALDKVIMIDQAPIGRTPRSNPATYMKVFDDIRDLFANLPESLAMGFKAGRFSFNVKEGSCLSCKGIGMIRIDMDFMEDEWVECPHCEGERFDPRTLAIRFKGKNIFEVLEMTTEEACQHFESIPPIRKKLNLLLEVGLGYLKIGQSSTTLSGGEAQRVKLAKELARPATGKTLYLLDEPTTGLHFEDIHKLLLILQKFVDKGNTVLVIEHNMELVKTADWVIDLGPEGGKKGGKIVGFGTPETLAKYNTPTGHCIKKALFPPPLVVKKKATSSSKPIKTIDVVNAEQNHLKQVHCTIQRGSITVFTGPSGSGKSSLALQTIYAEGQRRYVESLPAYARQFIEQLPKPKVEEIRGLSPAIAIEQKRHAGNPRSTVGTITEIYDYLRVLYAKIGIAHCPVSKEKIVSVTAETIVDRLFEEKEGTKIQILAPLSLRKEPSFQHLVDKLIKAGYLRLRLNKTFYELTDPIPFEEGMKNEIAVIIDRIVLNGNSKKRLLDAIETANELSESFIHCLMNEKELSFNLAFMAIGSGLSYPTITPTTFSFNAEEGMCLECSGLGTVSKVNLLSHPRFAKASLKAIFAILFGQNLIARRWTIDFLTTLGIPLNIALEKLLPQDLKIVLEGKEEVKGGLCWIGLHPLFEKMSRYGKASIKEKLSPLFIPSPCPVCQGERLNPLARHVLVKGVSLPEFLSQPLDQAALFIKTIEVDKSLLEVKRHIEERLKFLIEIGVHYLSLDRTSLTLSGGEVQRIHLARQLGTGLTGTLYVLDEPSIGLHPHDNEKLNKALLQLKEQANTLILVEHDPLTIQIADEIFDFGPEGGAEGGRLLAQGTFEELKKDPKSLTGAYASKRIASRIAPHRAIDRTIDWITIENAKKHNLKGIDVKIPKNRLTVITGVSGSGKSTLIHDLLGEGAKKATSSRKKIASIEVEGCRISNIGEFKQLITLDQNPIGKTQRADIASYTDLLTHLRQFFASLKESLSYGLQPKHFSPNHFSGMCMECFGLGSIEVKLQLLPSVKRPCPSCQGLRLSHLPLSVRYLGINLGQILQMNSNDLLPLFSFHPKIHNVLTHLIELGLGSLQIGQEIQTLSQGEAQRLRLIRELVVPSKGTTLYLFDEPSTGLHEFDIQKLLPLFDRLIEKGHTLVVIEHNVSLIQYADYVIELGPLAGNEGGTVIAAAPPYELPTASITKKYLSNSLDLTHC